MRAAVYQAAGVVTAVGAVLTVVVGALLWSVGSFFATRAEMPGDGLTTTVLEMAAGAQVNGKMLYQTEAPRRLSAPGAVEDLGDAEPAHA